jgi:hypothetical protein
MLAGTLVYVYAGTTLGEFRISAELLLAFALLGIFPLIAKKALDVIKARRVYARWPRPARFDRNLVVDRNQVVIVFSDDQGTTWKHASMLRFDDPHSGGAEAWVIGLSDGRLLGTCWHIHFGEPGCVSAPSSGDRPNAYALSHDGGVTWKPMRSTGIQGQSTALTSLPDQRALFIYNQRKHGEVGVWLARVRPTDNDFGIEANEIIWKAETRTQTGTSGEHTQWEDFSFGEPSITPLPDGTLLVTLWCIQPAGRGIRFVKLRMQ